MHCRISSVIVSAVFAFAIMLANPAWSQLTPGSLDVHWNEGAANSASVSQPPLQVHPYNAQTYILREGLCTTWEAPFMYLLIGSAKAILIDTGDVADPRKVPLADTVLKLIPGEGAAKLPLLVVHTHRHLDHRAGDAQFTMPNVQVVGFDIDSVRRFYNFSSWPDGTSQVDLGDRVIDVIPTPGHNQTEVSFYDRNTGLFFSGDFLLPGRLLIDDASAELASAKRVAAFITDRPVGYVLGGHIEMDASGKMFEWQSTYHPNEHVLQMTKEDLLALPAAAASFNGFYTTSGKTTSGKFTMMNSLRLLIAVMVFSLLALIVLAVLLIRSLLRRRRAKMQRARLTM
jgi:hydroxyacylglutathione hydrolase